MRCTPNSESPIAWQDRLCFETRSPRDYCSREVYQRIVFPVVARLCGSAGEHPQANAIVIHAKQIREAADRPVGLRAQPQRAIPQVLGRIVRGVPYKRRWVNHEPQFPLRTKSGYTQHEQVA
jgi:hypothetical protein